MLDSPLDAPAGDAAPRRRRRGGRGRGRRAPGSGPDAQASDAVLPASDGESSFDVPSGAEFAEPTPAEFARPVAESLPRSEPDSESATAEVDLRGDARVAPAIDVDADGWPKFEEELPEERVPPEKEPPTEEFPALSPTGREPPRTTGDDRQERHGRGGRRGRGGRPFADEDRQRQAPDTPRGAPSGPPSGAPYDREPVLEPLDEAGPRSFPHEGDEGPAPRRGEGRAVLHFFHPERLDACQRAIGYHFRDLSFLENALTHSSIKSDDRPSYERLEFLGDSIVGLVISEYLYNLLPDCDEGDMTRFKSEVVSTEGLANAALACGLDRFLALGRGLLMKNEVPRSLIADVFEGVAGAVYLDRGYEAARLYILDHLKPFVDRAINPEHAERNFKSVLQQVAQRDLGETPHYDTLRESGPDRTRLFEVSAVLGRRRFPAGRAATKKEAEQIAAKIALQVILHERGTGEISKRRRDHHHGHSNRGPRRGPGRS